MTHFRLSHLKRINPLIILWLQTLFDSQFWVIKYASPLFFPASYLSFVEDALVLFHEMCSLRWMWLSDVSYNLLDISRGHYSRRGYGGCFMKHSSGKSSTVMAERWNDRMVWGREGGNNKECVCMHVCLCVCLHSSCLPGKGSNTIETIHIFTSANLIGIKHEQSYTNGWY